MKIAEVAPDRPIEDLVTLRDEIAFWRRQCYARIQMATWLLRGQEKTKDEAGAAYTRMNLRGYLAELEEAAARQWHPRCEICGKPLPYSDPHAYVSFGSDDRSSVHPGCVEATPDMIVAGVIDDPKALVAAARKALGDEQ